MNILAVNAGIGASICLLEKGVVIFAMEEERPTRSKGKGGFPFLCFEIIKKDYQEFLQKLDAIAICDLSDECLEREGLLDRYARRFEEYDHELVLGYVQKVISVLRRALPRIIVNAVDNVQEPESLVHLIRSQLNDIDIPHNKIFRLRHHDCHAAAAYFGLAREFERQYLVLTLDGGGDSECSTVSVGHKGVLRRIATTESGNSIGNIYSNMTYILGLKPHEHEYKLMGLEPYVAKKYRQEIIDILEEYIWLDKDEGLTFVRGTKQNTNWVGRDLASKVKYKRFDVISAGLQEFTEELLINWVKNAVKHTGISDVLLSGGVFMNVKVNKRISEIPELRSVNVFPSCGDETNPFGVAFHVYSDQNGGRLPRFDTFTLGPKPTFDLEETKISYSSRCNFEKLDTPNETIAYLLAKGNIVARCSGPMEVGARALGNRSIFADPSSFETKEELNLVIKQRDFWMPFAPAILAEDADRYLEIPDSLKQDPPQYMMFGFDTKSSRGELSSAIHYGDKTARAQIVTRELYPDLHEILSSFKKITGRGALLNTSFNRHGEPIIMGTKDAVEILLSSSLKYLVVEDYLVTEL